jgi:LuxR family maltose regulon positive regulatory protein
MALARVWLALGQTDQANELLARLLHAAEATGRQAACLEVLVLQAMALKMQGDDTAAMRSLERALTLAQPGSYVRVFVNEGESMRALIARYETQYGSHAGGVSPAFVEKLLAAFPLTARHSTTPASIFRKQHSESLVEPLSDREIEVLRLVAAGLSDRQAAEELVVAVGTVKRHLNNAYGKLGVHSRTQALARAAELGLL